MRSRVLVLSLAAATSVFAQTVTRSFGSVVFPGGTSATTPGITRNFGSAVFPGSAPVPTVRGGSSVIGAFPPASVLSGQGWSGQGWNGQGFHHGGGQGIGAGRGTRGQQPYVFAYPVFVGGGYDPSYMSPDQGPPPQQLLQQPQPPQNITVIYPPTQHATPMMIQPAPEGDPYTQPQRGATIFQGQPSEPAAVDDRQPDSTDTHYLIAFKDHIIYSAVAYWVDGDTLHYFTSGNTHNQASLSLVDRDLTERLNKELGIDFKLAPAK
jgi:hypothetical protein